MPWRFRPACRKKSRSQCVMIATVRHFNHVTIHTVIWSQVVTITTVMTADPMTITTVMPPESMMIITFMHSDSTNDWYLFGYEKKRYRRRFKWKQNTINRKTPENQQKQWKISFKNHRNPLVNIRRPPQVPWRFRGCVLVALGVRRLLRRLQDRCV